MADKVVPYSEKNYKQKEALYDCIAQAFVNLKARKYSNHRWNVRIEDLNGIQMKLLNREFLSLTYHRIEVGTTDSLARESNKGSEFLREVEKELKKEFKKLTKKALKLKKVKDDQMVEKYSHVSADTSWMVGSSRYGGPGYNVGKYLVRDTRVYQFDEDLLGDDE
jgi:hypothetical protein